MLILASVLFLSVLSILLPTNIIPFFSLSTSTSTDKLTSAIWLLEPDRKVRHRRFIYENFHQKKLVGVVCFAPRPTLPQKFKAAIGHASR